MLYSHLTNLTIGSILISSQLLVSHTLHVTPHVTRHIATIEANRFRANTQRSVCAAVSGRLVAFLHLQRLQPTLRGEADTEVETHRDESDCGTGRSAATTGAWASSCSSCSSSSSSSSSRYTRGGHGTTADRQTR